MSPAGAGDRLLPQASSGSLALAPGRPVATPGAKPIGAAAFLGVAVASFGGPLALAALYVPSILPDVGGSTGLVMLAATVVFGVPMAVWLRYARYVNSSGGLYAFVTEAAGRRAGLLQAGLWVASYALYLVYTTASIVYDTLPAVLPGVRSYQPLLEIAIPVALAGVMLAGRTVTLAVLGGVSAGQLALTGALAGVTIGHDSPAASFALHPPSGGLATATGQVALLYICGSLPLFLGGEVRPVRTVRRGLVIAYLLVAVAVTLAVYPLAKNPAFLQAPIPGTSVAQVFSGHSLAVAIGVGVAVSVAGVMLVEYLALSRLLHAVTAKSPRAIIVVLAAVLVGTAPITLIDPERIYNDLLKPSLIALWLSQLVVFAVYPRFAARFGRLRITDVALAVGGALFTVYGIYATLQHAST